MSDFGEVLDRLTAGVFAGGQDEESIRAAELALDVRFPPSYRRFLAHYGAVMCPGFEIAGLFAGQNDDEPPLWLNVVTINRQWRRYCKIPKGYVGISDDGGDFSYYLNTGSVDARGECPVVVLGPGADAVVVAQDFPDFVLRSVGGTLLF